MSLSKIMKALVIAVGTVCLACALAGCSLTGGSAAGADGGITVSASSETKVVPDKARISVAVTTEQKDAQKCQDQNAKTVNEVIAALRALEVSDENIQTNYSDLSPSYGSRTTGKDDEEEYDDWVIVGYEMTTSLTISGLEIDNVGTVMQACVAAGANQTNGVEYYASDYDQAYNEALAKAMETAHSKAEGIASSAGVGVGKVTAVTEGYQDTSYRYAASNAKVAMEEADSAGYAAETMPGEISINAQVTVTYAIS